MNTVMGYLRNHGYTREHLSAYLDGELTARERARVERHLSRCGACQQELQTLQRTVLLLRYAPMRAVPRAFTLPASAQREQTRYRRWQAGYGVLRTASVAVALMLVVLLSADALFSAGLAPMPLNAPQVMQPVAAPLNQPLPESQPAAAHAPAPTLLPQMTPSPAAAPEMFAVGAPQAPLAANDAPAVPLAVLAPTGEALVVEGPSMAESAPASEKAVSPPSTPEIVFGQAAPSSAVADAATLGGIGAGAGGAGGAGAGGAGAGSEVGGGGGDLEARGAGEGPATTEALAIMTRPTPPLDSSALQRAAVPLPTPTPMAPLSEAPAAPLPTPEMVMAFTPATPVVAAPELSTPPTAEAAIAMALPTTQPTEQAARVEARAQDPEPSAWLLWRKLRLAAGGLLGVLMMLVAGMLWLGSRRHI